MFGKPFVSDISIGTITSKGFLSALKGSFGRYDVVYTVYSPNQEELQFHSLPDKENYVQALRKCISTLNFKVTLLDDSVTLNGKPKNLLFFITSKDHEEALRNVLETFNSSLIVEKIY